MERTRKLIISSPKGIQNKEKFLSEALAEFRNRKICSFEKDENGNIIVVSKEQISGIKYFVKVYKIIDYANTIEFLNAYDEFLKSTNCRRYPRMISKLDYGNHVIILFKTEKRKKKKHKKIKRKVSLI